MTVATTEASTLHHIGRANRPFSWVQSELEAGRFPDTLRGNFAFVWTGTRGTVAAVDHIGTHPLFYSSTSIGLLFSDVEDVLAVTTENPGPRLQMAYLLGHSVGTETTLREIHRLEPGCYLENGVQRRYIDLAAYDVDRELDLDELRGRLEQAVARAYEGDREGVLLLSGGTDSSTLAGITRKLGLAERTTYLYVHSELASWTERRVVHQVANEMDVPVQRVEVKHANTRLPSLDRRLHAFWKDPTFQPKRMALMKARKLKATALTGEVGDQLFGGPKTQPLLRRAATTGVSAEDIGRMWVHLSRSADAYAGVEVPVDVSRVWRHHPLARDVYEELVEHIHGLFEGMRTRDLLNRFLLLNLILKGPFRVYPFSQDTVRWVHPMADWDVVDYALRLPSAQKIYGAGVLKRVLYDAFAPYLSELPWSQPKTGLCIPNADGTQVLRDFRPAGS